MSCLHVVQHAGVAVPRCGRRFHHMPHLLSMQKCTRPRNISLICSLLLSFLAGCPGEGFPTLGLGFPLGVCPSPGSAVARLVPLPLGQLLASVAGRSTQSAGHHGIDGAAAAAPEIPRCLQQGTLMKRSPLCVAASSPPFGCVEGSPPPVGSRGMTVWR